MPGAIDERVLVDPADAGRVGAERVRRSVGQARPDRVQVLEHARARPVEVGAFLEDDVHEGHPEHRLAAHGDDVRRAEQRGHDRIRDLVLDERRRASRPLGEDDDLRIGEIGDRVELDPLHRDPPPIPSVSPNSSTSARYRADASMMRTITAHLRSVPPVRSRATRTVRRARARTRAGSPSRARTSRARRRPRRPRSRA